MVYAILLLAIIPILAAFIGWAETREDDYLEITEERESTDWRWPSRSLGRTR